MNNKKLKNIILLLIILTVFLNSMDLNAVEEKQLADIHSGSNPAFKPMLVKVEANYDQFQPEETLILT